MATPIENIVEELVSDYLDDVIEDIIYNGETAYTSGLMRAASMLGIALTPKVAQEAVKRYIERYRYKLVMQGIITIASPIFNREGKIVRYVDEDIEWMKDKPANMRNELVDAIETGIKVGKPAGFKKKADGTYPEGTIAKDIQDIVGNYKSDAATISRTETARCYYNGERDRYAESGVEYVQWMAANDCCEMCEPYRGRIMPISECPSVPLHPNCRCDIRPILGSELEEYLRENL